MTSLSSIVHLDIVVVVSYTLDLGPNHVPIIPFDPNIILSLFLVIFAVMMSNDSLRNWNPSQQHLVFGNPTLLEYMHIISHPFQSTIASIIAQTTKNHRPLPIMHFANIIIIVFDLISCLTLKTSRV